MAQIKSEKQEWGEQRGFKTYIKLKLEQSCWTVENIFSKNVKSFQFSFVILAASRPRCAIYSS